ncbi:YbaN family protein [Pseudoalteromonas piratica]|uniref:YbaN family protein n=1 Tax=Pseudoalteromonas piratica TaxID=1348114 RepID=UPI0009E06372|nr:YbaN family protein [Pseudoalteromonas piratica]
MVKATVLRSFWLVIGLLSLMLGVIGIFLPLLPTTPFVLLSAFCFSKSSTRLHNWLLNHHLFGHLISDWDKYGVIRLKVKIIATSSMLLLVSYPLVFLSFATWLKAIVGVTIACVLLFIWTRPSQPRIN